MFPIAVYLLYVLIRMLGEPLGLTGNTGASTGEHLHLTTKKDGKAFDPTILIDYIRSVKNSSLNNLAF